MKKNDNLALEVLLFLLFFITNTILLELRYLTIVEILSWATLLLVVGIYLYWIYRNWKDKQKYKCLLEYQTRDIQATSFLS